MQGLLIENTRIVEAFAPKDITAGVNGAYVSLSYWGKCSIILNTGAWAGGTAAVTLGQATSSGGAGAKAVAFTQYYLSTSTNSVPVTTAVTGNTFNLSAANKCVVIEVLGQDLDFQNAFKWLRVEIAAP